MELVVPKRMSGLTGSSGLWGAAADTLDGATATAAPIPESASAEERNSRRLSRGSLTFTGMHHSLIGEYTAEARCSHGGAGNLTSSRPSDRLDAPESGSAA